MSTLVVVEEVLRESATPMTVKEIVAEAGRRLPSKSKTPDTVVARDLSMDLKRRGHESRFFRSSPGMYTLREFAAQFVADSVERDTNATVSDAGHGDLIPVLSSALRHERAKTMSARVASDRTVQIATPPLRLVGNR